MEAAVQAEGCKRFTFASCVERVEAPSAQGVLWWSHTGRACRRKLSGYTLLRRVNERVVFKTLQEEILRPHGSDLQELPGKELQQQTDSSLEKEVPWFLVTHGNKISLHSPSLYVPTSNRYEALAADKIKEQDSLGETAPTAHTKNCKRKQPLLVVGESLLKGTEAPVCQPDIQSGEAGCFLGAKIRDVTERLSQLVRTTYY